MGLTDSGPWLQRYSVVILPVLVVAEQVGVPLPAVPALLAVGALAEALALESPLSPEFTLILVATAPGSATVTRTFVSISSDCKPTDISFTAALAAPYMVCPGKGTKPPMLETFTICPSGLSSR